MLEMLTLFFVILFCCSLTCYGLTLNSSHSGLLRNWNRRSLASRSGLPLLDGVRALCPPPCGPLRPRRW